MELDKVKVKKLLNAENWLQWRFLVLDVVKGTWIKSEAETKLVDSKGVDLAA